MDMNERMEVAERFMPAMKSMEADCTVAALSLIPAGHKCGPISVTESQWNQQTDAFEARDSFYAAVMPTEEDAIRLMHAAYMRLKKLGWREAIYCPKDGSHFDAIEPGSTGIHNTAYIGEWPDGMWLIDGDSPSTPCLYKPTEAETRQWKERVAKFMASPPLPDTGLQATTPPA